MYKINNLRKKKRKKLKHQEFCSKGSNVLSKCNLAIIVESDGTKFKNY